MITGFIEGSLSYLRALGVLRQYGLMRYLLLVGFGGLLIGLLASWGIYAYYDEIGGLLAGLWPFEWGAEWMERIADGLTVLTMILLFFLIFKYLIFILLAPIMSLVSQRVEKHILGLETPSKMNLIGEIIRGLRITVRNIFREIGLTLILLILSLIFPFFSWLTTALILVIQAYYAGFGNMDYTLERYFDTEDSVRFISEHRGFAIGNGLIFLLMLPVPLLGMFLAPFLGAVGATIGTLKRLQSQGAVPQF